MQEPDPGLLVLDPRYTAGLLGVDQDGRAVDLTRLGPLAADQLHDPGLAGLRRYQRNRAAYRNGTVEETDTPKRSRGAGTQNAREQACSPCHQPPTAPLRGGNIAAPRLHPPDQAEPTPGTGPSTGRATPPPPPRAAQPDLPRPHLGRCPGGPSPPTIDAPDGRRPSRMSITRWSVRGLAQTVLTIGVFVAVAVGVEHLRDRLPHHGHRFVGHRWTRR